MTRKIQIVSGFATPNEVAKELGVSKMELKTIDKILNMPALRRKSAQNRSGQFVARKAAAKPLGTARRRSGSTSKTIWQVVKASKKNAPSSVR